MEEEDEDEGEEAEEGAGDGSPQVREVKWSVPAGFEVAEEPAKLDESLVGKHVYLRWEKYGWQLGKITDYAGTTGFVIGFSFPALLYLRSRRLAKKKNFLLSTHYSSYASSPMIAWGLFSFGIVMLIYVVFCLIAGVNECSQEVSSAL